MKFDPYALPVGRHFEADPRHPDQVYIVSEHRCGEHLIPVVSTYDRTDLESETEHSARIGDTIYEPGLGEDLFDLLDLIDAKLDEDEQESLEETMDRHREWTPRQ